MQVICYIKMGVQKDQLSYLRVDQAAMATQTKTSIQNFINMQTDYWMIFADPFLSDIFKLNKSEWNAAESTLVVTIDVDTKRVPPDAIRYPVLSPSSMALSVLNKFLYTNLMSRMPSFYYDFLKQHHIRKTAFFPIVHEVFMSVK